MKTRKKEAGGGDNPEEESGGIAGASVIDEGDIIKVTFGGDDEDDHHEIVAASGGGEAGVETTHHRLASSSSGTTTQFILQTEDGTTLVTTEAQPEEHEEPQPQQSQQQPQIQVSSARTVTYDIDEDTIVDNVWSTGKNALRDLLVYLVRKHHIDEVYDSKVKATNWDKLMDEFMDITQRMVGVQKTQVIRKWHNWKQYNKQHGKPHPFVVAGDVTVDDILDRVNNLITKAKETPPLARYLSKGGNEPVSTTAGSSGGQQRSASQGHELSAAAANKGGRPPANLERLKRLRERDFKVRRTGLSAMGLNLKKLEHEIALESLNYEKEKWRAKCNNNKLLQQKLQREHEIAQLKLEKAKTELAIKRHECASLGIPLPSL